MDKFTKAMQIAWMGMIIFGVLSGNLQSVIVGGIFYIAECVKTKKAAHITVNIDREVYKK